MKQHIEYQVIDPRTGIASRVRMEQSVRLFSPSDVPDAICCILDVLGGTGAQVLDTVHRMLVTEALRRAGDVQSEAARILGVTKRMMHYKYHVHNDGTGDTAMATRNDRGVTARGRN